MIRNVFHGLDTKLRSLVLNCLLPKYIFAKHYAYFINIHNVLRKNLSLYYFYMYLRTNKLQSKTYEL